MKPNKAIFILVAFVILTIGAAAGTFYWQNLHGIEPVINTPLQDSTQNIEKQTNTSTNDKIRVETPTSNSTITSPLTVKGEARGTWFFEASFPVKLLDANGKELATGIAQAKSNWMTTDFVPFETELTFDMPQTETGTLVLQKDNPSGLAENEDSIQIPVRFNLKL